MGWTDTWLPGVRDALIGVRGQGALDNMGATMPMCTAMDTIAILGQLAQPVVNVVNQAEQIMTGQQGVIPSNTIGLADGVLDFSGLIQAIATVIPAKDYVGGISDTELGGGNPWERSLASDPLGPTYEVWVGGSIPDTAQLGQLRQLMADWQRGCDASGGAISGAGTDASQSMDTLSAQNFWAAMQSICVDLDTFQEMPPTVPSLTGALSAAADATATFVGKSAAEAANEVGSLAGNVGGGFLSGIGPMGVAVAGIVIYLFVK